MNKWTVAAALSLAASFVVVACSDSGDSGQDACPGARPGQGLDKEELTVEELTDLVAEAATCPGHVLRLTSEADLEAGPYSVHMQSESWTEAAENLGRMETTLTPPRGAVAAEAEAEGDAVQYDSTTIVRGDGSYSREDTDEPASKGRVRNCHSEGQEALILVVPCYNGPLQEVEVFVEVNTTYDGKDAISHVATGESRGHDETYNTTTRTYYDATTFLPIGQTQEGTLDIGEVYPVDADFSYETAFVPLDSLAEDFFDPASLGYVEPDPYEVEAPLDGAEVPVYWLGRDFAGESAYPALTLDHAFVRPGARTEPGGSVVELTYRPADDEFGYNMARIGLFTAAAWDDREAITVQWPCEQTVDFEVNGHDARLKIHHHSNRQAEDGSCLPPDRYSAVIHFDEVVVALDAPATGNGRERFYSSYDSEEGIKLLARSLRLRE